MTKLNNNAKLAFYSARKRKGDASRIAFNTGYSLSHVSNIISGNRSVNPTIANALFTISKNRMKNKLSLA